MGHKPVCEGKLVFCALDVKEYARASFMVCIHESKCDEIKCSFDILQRVMPFPEGLIKRFGMCAAWIDDYF
jgi:hypothetical protein